MQKKPHTAIKRPTPAEIAAAADRTVPDLIAPGLDVLFCGINPSLYTSAVGYHFARPGNRFWPTLHAAGFTPRLLSPAESHELLDYGIGITNIVARATTAASDLDDREYQAGGAELIEKLQLHRPRCLAVLGIGAYRMAFGARHATLGLQPESLAATPVWVLPNPSGLNAHYQLPDLARLYAELRNWIDRRQGV